MRHCQQRVACCVFLFWDELLAVLLERGLPEAYLFLWLDWLLAVLLARGLPD